MSDLLEFFKARTEAIIAQTQTLVGYESPTPDKALNDLLGDYCRQQLEALGARVQVYPRHTVGDILWGVWNEDAPGRPLMILCHRDTVWPVGTLAKMPWSRDEYKIYGPGALDMKASLAMAWEAIAGLQTLGQFPQRPIWMLITSDEETGSAESRHLILELGQQCALCLVMEPSAENEGLKSSRKGIGRYWVTATGRTSHAGSSPEEGINAIVELAHHTLAIQALNQLRQGTSVSVTQVQGGIAGNVIPDQASLYVDVRFFYQAEAERVHQAMLGLSPVLPGAALEVTGGIDRPPMERDALMVNTIQQAQHLASQLGFSLGESAVGGVSDGNLTASAGIPTLDGLGPLGTGAHALHEQVLIRTLARRTALLASLLRDWQDI
jgi:glutamate carboxypeptidase